tara:strand:+ start:2402 stop:2818 length:417 start_codon:yes stop_codon:yes gene_type:complete
MAYSRWANSFWYTFWSFSESNKKEDQTFEICDFGHSMTFKYSELIKDIDECLEKVKDYFAEDVKGQLLDNIRKDDAGKTSLEYKEHTFIGFELEERYLEELRGYMTRFVGDVNEEYKDDAVDIPQEPCGDQAEVNSIQ